MTADPPTRPGHDHGWLDDPVECGPAAGFGLFLAVAPSGPGRGPADRYHRAVRRELAGHLRRRDWPAVTSVYLAAAARPAPLAAVTALLGRVRAGLALTADAEVTVELHPAAVHADLLAGLAAAGATRLSVVTTGAGPADPTTVVAAARRAGIARVDLGLTPSPDSGRTAGAGWRRRVAATAAAGPDHVTVPVGEGGRRRLQAAADRLADAGLERYELISFARGRAARGAHNVLYWRHGPYLGVGAGAHSDVGGRRWWTHGRPEDYAAAVSSGRSPVAGDEHPTVAERATERLLLGLRLAAGLHPGDLPPVDAAARRDLAAEGLLTTGADGRLRATREGWWLLDEVVTRLTSSFPG